MVCKCKPPTQEYSNPNVPLPSLKFFKTKSKSTAHIFNTWPVPNSHAHFLLLPSVNYPLYSSHTKLFAAYRTPHILSSWASWDVHRTSRTRPYLYFVCRRHHPTHAPSTVAIHSRSPNSPSSCHCCHLSQILSSPTFYLANFKSPFR